MTPNRVVLDGVPRVGYHAEGRRWSYHFSPWAGCLAACMAYLGEDISYHHVVGTSGMGFRLLWNSQSWDLGNVGDLQMGSAEPYRRTFATTGYTCELLYNGKQRFGDLVGFLGPSLDRETLRQRIVESIADAGQPVIAWGVVGPPEACVITGYDEGGDVLVGWSHFQDNPSEFPEQDLEPSGAFRRRDWFQHTLGLVLIGDKQEKPPLSETYRSALEWALQVVRTPMVDQHYNGLRAYEGWAEFMRREEDIQDDKEALELRKGCLYDAMCMVAEREKAAAFLQEMAAHEPGIAMALEAAVDCYTREVNCLGQIHAATDGFIRSDEQLRKLGDPEARERIAQTILEGRVLDAEAADLLEQALKAG